MKHPREYTTVPFGGLHIMQVDAGTVIKDERSGKEFEVTDDTFVTKGNLAYCTEKTFEALKRKVQ